MDKDGDSSGHRIEKQEKKKKKSGDRCMVMHCSSNHETASVFRMPGPMPGRAGEGARFTSLQMAWIHFINRNRKFEHTKVKHIFVCSRHFDDTQFDPTQLRMYQMGLRTRPPLLLPNSIPHIYNPDVMDMDVESTTTSTSSTQSQGQGIITSTSTPSSTVLVMPSVSGGSASGSSSDSTRKRARATYFRKKEVAEITKEYSKRAEEQRILELTEDIVRRSKGHQFSAKMVDRKVGLHKWKRSCKVQVKPITVSRGMQVNFIKQRVDRKVQFCDGITQTTESSFAELSKVTDDPEPMEEPEEEPEEEPGDEPDDEIKDPTYKPNESDYADNDRQTPSQPQSIRDETKYIVFESNLLDLFRVCTSCLSRNVRVQKISPRSFGSQLKVEATCLACAHHREWLSQPKVGNVMAGNLQLSAAILFGGGSPTKVLRVLKHMNLKAISVQTFLEHQREYLQPAIIRVAKRQQATILSQVAEGEKLVLGGDGRADSPGHCAKYGSYTFMDMKRNKILDIQLVQSNEVSSSNAMEKEGLDRGLASLYEKGLEVGTLITDRHAQVAKWLRQTYPDIAHKYDVWHIAKGLKKKIKAVAKLKDCEVVGRWMRSILNHIYWCASSTPDGDGDVIVAKYKSILNHMRNIHDDHGELYPACAHGADYSQREWMKQGTKAFEKLSEQMTKTRFMNDLKKMSPQEQTSSVEAFHSVMLYWCPKMLAYSYTGMKCRLQLAAMHWNENAGRGQATKADGTPMYRISYPKAKEGGHTVSKVLTACTFNYVKELMDETMQLVSEKLKLRHDIPELQAKPGLCSRFERPDKAEAIKQLEAHRRFSKE